MPGPGGRETSGISAQARRNRTQRTGQVGQGSDKTAGKISAPETVTDIAEDRSPIRALVDLARRALDRNVVMGPWIHVSSEVRHLGLWRVGEPLSTRGRVAALWEKNGHEYVELDLLMVAEETRPVAHVRHRRIYQVATKELSV